MHDVKDTQRSVVKVGYDGRVHKYYRGPSAKERYENEVSILEYLERKGCTFVPRILENHPEDLYIVTTNCGHRADNVSEETQIRLFRELEQYGVRHDDPFVRNITYNMQTGRFCVIDFEFATNLETGHGLRIEDVGGRPNLPRVTP